MVPGTVCLWPLGLQELLLGRHQLPLFHPFCSRDTWGACLCLSAPPVVEENEIYPSLLSSNVMQGGGVGQNLIITLLSDHWSQMLNKRLLSTVIQSDEWPQSPYAFVSWFSGDHGSGLAADALSPSTLVTNLATE